MAERFFAERPVPPEPPAPRCPWCGQETDTFYQDRDGRTVGCAECLRPRDAWEEVYK